MKKKILFVLLAIVTLFTMSGCGSKKESNDNKETQEENQTEYKEGKYSIDDLTFDLYEGFKKSYDDNIYQLANDENGIAIYFYHDKNIKTSLDEYIKSDPNDFLPNTDKISAITLNGNEWQKGVTNDGAYIYYIKRGNDVYSIMILPMYTTKATLNDVISTLENSLYFKK